MSDDRVRAALERSAARPRHPVDPGRIIAAGARLRRRRALAVAGALLAVAGAAAAGIGWWTEAPPQVRPAAPREMQWEQIALPPDLRYDAGLLWAGSELIVWGRCAPLGDACDAPETAFTLDADTPQWRTLRWAPEDAAAVVAVWTGSEAVFVPGGDRRPGRAYDPASRSWRPVARSPRSWEAGSAAVWTGTEMLVWGGGDSGGAAYDPDEDSWRLLADAAFVPEPAAAAWTGAEMIVLGAPDGRGSGEAAGAAYDPGSDSWRELPPSGLSALATTAVWTGRELVAWDYDLRSRAYDPAVDRWGPVVPMPLEFSECHPTGAPVAGVAVAYHCGDGALYDPETGSWRRIFGGPLEDEVAAATGAVKLWRFANIVGAGEAAFAAIQGVTISQSGEPCYGCPGSPLSLWKLGPGA